MAWFYTRIFLVVLLGLPVVAAHGQRASETGFIAEINETEGRIQALVPLLWARKAEFANDPEMLLGLAIVVDQFAPDPQYARQNADLYRKILEIEPANKAAMAAFARHSVVRFITSLRKPLLYLEMQRQYAEQHDLKEVMIPSYSELYPWFGEEGKDFVMISDFSEARSKIIQKQTQELPSVISILDDGKRIDPNNALYDYLGAQLDFELGHDRQGLSSVQKGTAKPKLDNYLDQVTAARKRVLESVAASRKDLEMLDSFKIPAGLHMDTEKLFRMAGERIAAGKAKAAADIYQLLMRIADQLEQENARTAAGGAYTRRELIRHIQRKAEKKLSVISATYTPEELR